MNFCLLFDYIFRISRVKKRIIRKYNVIKIFRFPNFWSMNNEILVFFSLCFWYEFLVCHLLSDWVCVTKIAFFIVRRSSTISLLWCLAIHRTAILCSTLLRHYTNNNIMNSSVTIFIIIEVFLYISGILLLLNSLYYVLQVNCTQTNTTLGPNSFQYLLFVFWFISNMIIYEYLHEIYFYPSINQVLLYVYMY